LRLSWSIVALYQGQPLLLVSGRRTSGPLSFRRPMCTLPSERLDLEAISPDLALSVYKKIVPLPHLLLPSILPSARVQA
jgi:hypothetical protein